MVRSSFDPARCTGLIGIVLEALSFSVTASGGTATYAAIFGQAAPSMLSIPLLERCLPSAGWYVSIGRSGMQNCISFAAPRGEME